jgi:hypothetical protein
MCVQATYFIQKDAGRRRVVVHLFNGVSTTASHGLPATEAPLREEVIPVHGMEVTFSGETPKEFHCEPGNRAVEVRREGASVVVRVPVLEVHAMLVGEY